MSEQEWDRMRARHDARTGRSPMGNESPAYRDEHTRHTHILNAGKWPSGQPAQKPSYPSSVPVTSNVRGRSEPLTMAGMAKGGAWLAGAVAAFLLWAYSNVNLGQMVVYAAAAAFAGAIAGGILHVALQVFEVAVRVAAVLLLIGVVLHFLGVLNLFQVLGRIGRTLGL